MTKAILVAQFLQARAWWRLDSAGDSALHVARSVVSLLDAAAYPQGMPGDDPDLLALQAAPIGIPRQVTAPEVPAPAR